MQNQFNSVYFFFKIAKQTLLIDDHENSKKARGKKRKLTLEMFSMALPQIQGDSCHILR